MKYILLAILLLMLCSCVPPNVDNMIGPNQPEPYKTGFVEGFGSGQKAEGSLYDKFQKNVMRFSQDDLYRQGWTDGFEMGKGRWKEIKRYSSY